jgi:ribosomal protein S12 methylthiotransferase accessory factor
LFEVAERCSIMARDDPRSITARADDLERSALNVRSVLHFSETQYRRRGILNRRDDRFDWIPPPFDETVAISWIPAERLSAPGTVYLPTDYCYRRPPGEREFRICPADSNGCASGVSLDDATLGAFLELVERDAVAMWWYLRARRPAWPTEVLPAEVSEPLARWLRDKTRSHRLLDLTTDLELPVAASVSWAEDGRNISFGFGAGFSVPTAALRAVEEMLQVELIARHTMSYRHTLPDAKVSARARTMRRWFAEARIQDHPHFVPVAETEYTQADDSRPERSGDRSRIAFVVDLLARRGFDMLRIDLTHADIGVPTARVVVPGLRSMKPRFGPGRLYDVPIALGWVEAPVMENELNPLSMFA